MIFSILALYGIGSYLEPWICAALRSTGFKGACLLKSLLVRRETSTILTPRENGEESQTLRAMGRHSMSHRRL